MRIFEKHKNGAVIDMEGEPDRVSSILMDWRKYQDTKEAPKHVSGFIPREEAE